MLPKMFHCLAAGRGYKGHVASHTACDPPPPPPRRSCWLDRLDPYVTCHCRARHDAPVAAPGKVRRFTSKVTSEVTHSGSGFVSSPKMKNCTHHLMRCLNFSARSSPIYKCWVSWLGQVAARATVNLELYLLYHSARNGTPVLACSVCTTLRETPRSMVMQSPHPHSPPP